MTEHGTPSSMRNDMPMLSFDERRQPCVQWAGAGYRSFDALISANAGWADEHSLSQYCALLLHFHPGPGCTLITEPEMFCERYAQRYGMPAETLVDDVPPIAPPPPGVESPADAPQAYAGGSSVSAQDAPTFSWHAAEADPTVLADFGRYDVSEVALPTLKEGRVVFYAEEIGLGVPYRVEAPWPVVGNGEVRYQLLSHASS